MLEDHTEAHPARNLSGPRARIAALARSSEARSASLAGLAAFVLYELTQEPGPQIYNMDVLVADALLQGRLDIPDAPAYLETVPVDGRDYSPKGPIIALLLLPFVAIWGVDFNQRHAAALLGAAIAMAAWALSGKIGLAGWRRVAAWTVPVLGTTVWYEAKTGALWGIASLGAVLFGLLALNEYFGRRRPWLIGLFCGLGMLSRGPVVAALAGFGVQLGPRRWLPLAAGLAGPLTLYVAYNLARYGTPMDVSLNLLYEIDDLRERRPHGAFSPAYIPHTLYHWLFLAPGFQDTFPWLRLNFLGQGIFLTSPVLLVALTARRDRWMWLSMAAIVLPAAMFYSIGASQFGIRYLLDAVPFAFALICLSLADRRAHGFLPLLAASVAMNAYGVFYTNVFGLAP